MVVVLGITTTSFILRNNASGNVPDSATLQKGMPDYPTILPAGKTAEDFGGWTRISPPDRNPVFAYTDKINNVSINVSQQPLPKDFTSETDTHVQQLANSFFASQKEMAGNVPIYIGTSTEGPQSVIFHKNGLLVLIKSTDKLSNDQWSAYIGSLK